MNLLLSIVIFSGLNLYFLKDSPLLLVKIIPEEETEQITVYYSFTGTKWDSVDAKHYTTYFAAIITPPETSGIIGFYLKYNQKIDDNKGALYLYEFKVSPRMIMPFSLDYLETMLKLARKKLISQTHIDEAITIIDYVDKIIQVVPYIKGTEQELRIKDILSELNELKSMIAK